MIVFNKKCKCHNSQCHDIVMSEQITQWLYVTGIFICMMACCPSNCLCAICLSNLSYGCNSSETGEKSMYFTVHHFKSSKFTGVKGLFSVFTLRNNLWTQCLFINFMKMPIYFKVIVIINNSFIDLPSPVFLETCKTLSYQQTKPKKTLFLSAKCITFHVYFQRLTWKIVTRPVLLPHSPKNRWPKPKTCAYLLWSLYQWRWLWSTVYVPNQLSPE